MEKYTNLTTGGPVNVWVDGGKIKRITPLKLDDTDSASWTISARGRRFTPPRRATVSPYTVGQKSMVYAPNRNLYPMKRVDFDPDGERNPQNRGVSGYVRISWDEALSIVAGEIIRIRRKYGSAGVFAKESSHQLWGNVGYHNNSFGRFRGLTGMSQVVHNPDSWEGWYWGAIHMWGFTSKLGLPEQFDLLEDALKNTEMIVFWSSDPEATAGVYAAFETNIWRRWLKELGVEMIFIDPYYNHTAALFADKWLAPKPGTDTCIALAIAYVWLTEGTFDKEYMKNRTVGFDEWADYVLGKDDSLPKTPEWASAESGVPAWDIRALARKWAKKKTMLGCGGIGGFGGACRQASGNEWARLMICLAAMQGMGKPGCNIWSTQMGAPVNTSFNFPGYTSGIFPTDPVGARHAATPSPSTVQRLRLPEAIIEGETEWYGVPGPHPEHQFQKLRFPQPGLPGIKMIYSFGASEIGTMTETNRYADMYRHSSLECVVMQSPWFEGECRFADIILPACTNFERWDIGEFANSGGRSAATYTQCNHRIIVLQHKCIEPLGESKSDYDIFALLSERLGIGYYYTEGGKSEFDWVKRMFDTSDLPKYISWDEFLKKGYFVVPPETDKKFTPAFRWFAEGRSLDTPDSGPAPRFKVTDADLQTRSGKLEIHASTLDCLSEIDPDRPAIPKYIPSWEGTHSTERLKKYPLQLITPHPRFSFHTMGDGKDSFMNDIKDHRVLIDGYYYWIARVNPVDAASRDLKNDDLALLYNDRGAVICAVQVTNRVPPGVVHSYGSAAVYDPLGLPGKSVDRGGCVNLLTSKRFLTPTSSGMACNSTLIQVKKYEGEVALCNM
ncbi:MAG: molybdopterin-dependent oxidoreductase [Oscillospiraceae bacterium]